MLDTSLSADACWILVTTRGGEVRGWGCSGGCGGVMVMDSVRGKMAFWLES